MEGNKIKYSVELSHISNKCLRQIKNTTTAVEYLFHAVNNNDNENFPPLEVDGLPFRIEDPENQNEEISAKDLSIDWILKKAFEDFIVGLTESLIEAYKALKVMDLSRKTKNRNYSQEEIDKEIEKINQRPLSLPFPKLIDEIESELNSKLFLSQEMKTINNLRNCLVHDNGIVSEKRLNDKKNRRLTLEFIELVVFAERDGQIIQVTRKEKKNGFQTKGMFGEFHPRASYFSKGERIKITPNLFNCISYTCAYFVNNLFEVVPKTLETN